MNVCRMSHRKWREIKQQLIRLPDLALIGCSLLSLHVVCDILQTFTVLGDWTGCHTGNREMDGQNGQNWPVQLILSIFCFLYDIVSSHPVLFFCTFTCTFEWLKLVLLRCRPPEFFDLKVFLLLSCNQCDTEFSRQLTCHAMTTDKATGAGNLLIHHTTAAHRRGTLWRVCGSHCFMHSNNVN